MFTGFTEKHFDAYQAAKWRSRVFNLERMEVKAQLAALGRDLSATLAAASSDPLVMELSAEHPALYNQKQVDAQHLYFMRSPEARRDIDRVTDRARGMASLIQAPSPQRSHIHLGVSVRHDHLLAGLVLHHDASVDRENLERRLRDPHAAQAFLACLAALPPEIHIGLANPGAPAHMSTPESLHALLAELAAPLAPGQSRWLTVGRRMERDHVISLGQAAASALEQALVTLLPVYHHAAWSPDNDHIDLASRVAEDRDPRSTVAEDRDPRSTVAEDRAPRSRSGLKKHDTVTVVRGMFAGRAGVVQEIDARGMVKLLIGTIPVKVRAEDLGEP